MKFNKKTLVTGATGFIGSHLVKLLADKGVPVAATDIKPSAEIPSSVTFVQADIRDQNSVEPLLQNVDRIFHVAGICNFTTPHQKLAEVNIHGVDLITKLSIKHKIRSYVHLSSSSVYGLYQGNPFSEDSDCKPAESYGRSKLAGEAIVKSRIQEGLQAVILRPCTVYGPGCNDGAGKVFSRPSDIAGIPGSGRQKLANVRVEDVASAAEFLSQKENAIGQIFNVADDSQPELAQALNLAASVFQSNIKQIHVPLAVLKVLAQAQGIIAKLQKKIPDLEYEAIKYLYSDYIVNNAKLKSFGYELLYPEFSKSMQQMAQ